MRTWALVAQDRATGEYVISADDVQAADLLCAVARFEAEHDGFEVVEARWVEPLRLAKRAA